MDAKHTPGPWFPHVDKNGRPSVTAGGVERIADCWHTAAGDGNANAHLIAAAPDLLAALKGMLACYGYINPKLWTDEEHIARAAIAKATRVN